jgi:peptide-methionine (S)-S-oxide reductase
MTATRRKISSDRVVPYALAGLLALPIVALVAQTGMVGAAEEPVQIPPPAVDAPAKDGMATAVFAGGCFWGVQGVFQHVDGVESAVSGYAGGTVTDPSYKQVSRGNTGHAESVEVTYNPAKVSYGKLLQVFFSVAHDPTQLNRQGADVGTQYRSVIFFHDEAQRQTAEKVKAALDASGAYDAPIVTRIVPFDAFYEAEGYHHDYFERHPDRGYCRAVIAPKVEKFRKAFADLLRDQPSPRKP